MVNKLKGATKANIWQERINEKCSIIIKLSKNVTNRVNQLAFKLSDGKLERPKRKFSKLYKTVQQCDISFLAVFKFYTEMS